MKLIWTDRAVQDIELIADYISQDSEEASARWVRTIIEKLRKSLNSPVPAVSSLNTTWKPYEKKFTATIALSTK